MNNLNRLKKYWPVYLLLIALLLGYLLNTLSKKQIAVTEIPKPTPIPTPLISAFPSVDAGFVTPKQITWRLTKLDLPASLPVLHLAPPSSDPNTYVPVAKVFGLSNTSTKIPDLPIIIFNSPDNSADYYVNLKDRLAKYQANLTIKPLPQTGTILSPDTLLNQLSSTLSPVLNLPAGFALAGNTPEYEIIDGERYIPAPVAQANILQVTIDYTYNNLPVKYRGLPAIIAKYSLFGPLISVTYALPPSALQAGPDYQLKTFAQIKQTPADKFEVISISGNREFTLSDQDEIVTSTTITDGYLGYLLSPDSTAITPYIFLTGTSTSKNFGTLSLTLATPAILLPTPTP